MEKSQITRCQFVKTGKDTAKMLNFVDKTFDQMAFTVQPSIVRTGRFSFLVRWNDGFRTLLHNPIDQGLSSIASICDYVRSNHTLQQCLGVWTIVALSCGQMQTQGVAQAIDQ